MRTHTHSLSVCLLCKSEGQIKGSGPGDKLALKLPADVSLSSLRIIKLKVIHSRLPSSPRGFWARKRRICRRRCCRRSRWRCRVTGLWASARPKLNTRATQDSPADKRAFTPDRVWSYWKHAMQIIISARPLWERASSKESFWKGSAQWTTAGFTQRESFNGELKVELVPAWFRIHICQCDGARWMRVCGSAADMLNEGYQSEGAEKDEAEREDNWRKWRNVNGPWGKDNAGSFFQANCSLPLPWRWWGFPAPAWIGLQLVGIPTFIRGGRETESSHLKPWHR